MKQTPLCIGIDPGYDRVGWAIGKISNPLDVIEYGCIETDKKQSLFERYAQIGKVIKNLCEKHHPSEAAIETLYFSRNTSTALPVSEARGVIIGQLLDNCKIFEYSPGTIKLAVTGSGRAPKTAIDKMVRMQLNLRKQPELDDTMDALAVLLTHAVSRRN